MTDEQWRPLRGLLLQAGTTLFDAHGLVLEDGGADEVPGPRELVAASASLTGTGLRVRLTLLMDHALLRCTHPLWGRGALKERELRGWSCELLNQLLGLLKAQLRARGLHGQAGLPTCLIGPEVGRIYAPREKTRAVILVGRGGSVQIRVHGALSAGVVIGEVLEGAAAGVPGGVLLFD